MAKRKLIALSVTALALSGCVTYWTKPGATDRDFAKDQYECERDSEMAYGQYGAQNAYYAARGGGVESFTQSLEKYNFLIRCIESKGWIRERAS
jgi:hypothetical protein